MLAVGTRASCGGNAIPCFVLICFCPGSVAGGAGLYDRSIVFLRYKFSLGSVAGGAGEESEGLVDSEYRTVFIVVLADSKFMRTHENVFLYYHFANFPKVLAELGDLVWGHFGSFQLGFRFLVYCIVAYQGNCVKGFLKILEIFLG